MKVGGLEFYDLLEMFEKDYPGRHDKEPYDMWPMKVIYQDGEMNKMFQAYIKGYSFGKLQERLALLNEV